MPGNTEHPAGGDAPYALWVRWDNGETSLNQAVVSSTGRGFSTMTHQTKLPAAASNNSTYAVVSGEWSLITWEVSDANNPGAINLFVRLKGPGVDSQAVKVEADYRGDARSVRLVLDASGHARAFWDLPHQDRWGVNGLFNGGTWVPQPDIAWSVSASASANVAPDGQGWYFATPPNGRTKDQWLVKLTAAGGYSSVTRLDDPALGDAVGPRLIHTEGLNGFTTAVLQQMPGASSACLAVRRLVAANLGATQCINVTADSLPNLNYGELVSDASGHALMTWSTGYLDRAVYVSRRNTANTWAAPSKLVDVTGASDTWSRLVGLKAAINSTGQAVVAYGINNGGGAGTLRAQVAQPGGAWSTAQELVSDGAFTRDASVSVNAKGVPGVLQLVSKAGGTDAVTMSTWVNGAWSTTDLRSGIQLAFYNYILLSSVRLAPQGSKGWLAVWDEGNGQGDSQGYREIWAAEYR
jgi:hypothetical protein